MPAGGRSQSVSVTRYYEFNGQRIALRLGSGTPVYVVATERGFTLGHRYSLSLFVTNRYGAAWLGPKRKLSRRRSSRRSTWLELATASIYPALSGGVSSMTRPAVRNSNGTAP
jgi:hypothetical protein